MKTFSIYFRAFFISIVLLMGISSCDAPPSHQQEKRKPIVKKEQNKPSDSISKTKIVLTDADAIQKKTIDKDKITYYTLDHTKSIISWFCVTHTGYVKFESGKIGILDDDIVEAHFEVCMDSIADTDINYILMRDVLTNTLKSADFFDTGKYPKAIFTLSHLKKEEKHFYIAAGDLRIKDISKQIQFKSNIIHNDSMMMIISERFAIDRTLWDITIYSENFEQTDDSFLFTDMVDLQVTLYLKRQ